MKRFRARWWLMVADAGRWVVIRATWRWLALNKQIERRPR